MSASEDELYRESFIDTIYEDFQSIIHELSTDKSPVEHYSFSNATEFLNYVENEIMLGEKDIERVREEYENPKCPYCEELDDVDATLMMDVGYEKRESFKVDEDVVTIGYFEVDCRQAHDVGFRYEEKF